MKKRIINFLLFILCYFVIDYSLSSLFLFKIIHKDLEKIYYSDLKNRIPNKDYKYTFKPNSQFFSKYNDFIYEINTNNFGFRDRKINLIKPDIKKKVYFFAGDSFLEGVGLNYKDTLIGQLAERTNNEYLLLNSGVASYSPYLYKRKIISFLENNKEFKLEKIIILFDKSDPIDDSGYKNHTGEFEEKYNFSNSIYKKKFSEKFTTFTFLKLLANYLDEYQRNLKYRYKLSKKYELNFFEFTNNQVIAFKSINNRKFITNYYTNENIWNDKTKNYISDSFSYISELSDYLSKKNIELEIFIYPWAYELVNSDLSEKYIQLISSISKSKSLIVHNCYDYFYENNSLDQLETIGRNYLFADVHYNSNGNKILSSCIKDKLKL